MENGSYLVLLLLVVLFFIWLLILEPKAKAAREERQRLEAERRAKREADLIKLRAERDELLNSILSKTPTFITSARRDFESEYRKNGGEGIFGQEMSPLVCFGYRVGTTKGRKQTDRQAILEYAVAADYDASLPFLPASYRDDWGGPLSITRYKRIYLHLKNLADLREGRRNYAVAVSHWRADAEWFQTQQRPRVEKFYDL